MNLRPSGYEPDELPGCSTSRRVMASIWRSAQRAAIPPLMSISASGRTGSGVRPSRRPVCRHDRVFTRAWRSMNSRTTAPKLSRSNPVSCCRALAARFSAAGSSPPPGPQGHHRLACGPCHIDRRIRAERQFARVASISVAHGPGLRAGGLNDEIQPGQTRIRNLAAHRPWFQLFDGLGGEQLGHISEPLG